MTHCRGQIGENVKDMRVVVLYVSRAMIAKKMVEPLFGFRKIDIALAVDNVNVFACVSVVKKELVLALGWLDCHGHAAE
jgi:hypothetical protein